MKAICLICSNKTFAYLKVDDAHKASWAFKHLNTAEYFFWERAFRVYRGDELRGKAGFKETLKETGLQLPKKRGLQVPVNQGHGTKLQDLFVSLFGGDGFWMSQKSQKDFEGEAVQNWAI